MDPEVLIVGAGPTGLVLALWLARLGVRVRIVDKGHEPGTTSRAVVVQARTLEMYRQLGLADAVVRAGIEFSTLNVWARGKRGACIEFGRMGQGLSPFPYVLDYPQDEHERLLIQRLGEFGVRVERGVELSAFEQADGSVQARLRGPEGASTCQAAFLAGCDGAHSIVRETLKLGFPGGTYAQYFYVADVEASGPPVDGQLHISLDANDFAGIFPLKQQGHVRLIGTVRPEAGQDPGWDQVSKQILARMHVEVRQVRWFSTYKVHHRVAAHFRRGQVFLLGDAAHIHSPVGGQGMNTGIADAINLAWKLAAVLRGRAPLRVLDSFEQERIGFARRLTATTDRIFRLVTRPSRLAALARIDLIPPALAALFRLPSVRRYVFRTVSQIAIEYRTGPLSEGRAGVVRGGDRLPWVSAEGGDNFAPLDSVDWQVHVYGAVRQDLAHACASHGVPLHAFAWSTAARVAGLARDASYLVRPDGYVALADPLQSPLRLEQYLDRRGLRVRPIAPRAEAAESHAQI